MKRINSKLRLALISIVLAGGNMYTADVHSRMRHSLYFDDVWRELDDMYDHIERMREMHEDLSDRIEATEPIKIQKFKVEEKADISETDDSVVIKITINSDKNDKKIGEKSDEAKSVETPDKPISENDVDVIVDGNLLTAKIKLKDGAQLTLFVDNHSLTVTKKIEIRKEKKTEKGESKVVSYADSSYTRSLPADVVIKKSKADLIKAEVKDNSITLTLPKEKHVKVPVVSGNPAVAVAA